MLELGQVRWMYVISLIKVWEIAIKVSLIYQPFSQFIFRVMQYFEEPKKIS
jgi:hypothetical protein